MSSKLQELLGAKAGTVSVDATGSIGREGSAGSSAPVSETALELDRWGMSRGRSIAEKWKGAGLTTTDITAAADCHGALFEPHPKLAENPADKRRAAWLKQCMSTPEYKSLHEQTCLRGPMAGIASRSIYEQYAAYVLEHPEGNEPGDNPGGDGEDISDGVARIRSTQKALDAAQKDMDAAEGLGQGLGIGNGGNVDGDRLAAAFANLRRNPRLREISMLAGRMICRCRSLQKQKLSAPHGEITGIEMTGDVSRLLPLELAMVAGAVPALQTHALYRLSQRRMFGYKHKLKQPVQNGPIVVGVDESGSMDGEPIIAAKALALSLAWLARQQNRWIALYSFGDQSESRYIAFPPGIKNDDELLKWCSHFYNGGTSMRTSMQILPNTWWKEMERNGLPKGKTDHIIITDAQVNISPVVVQKYQEWAKEETCKTYGLIIGCSSAGDLAGACNRHWLLQDLTLKSEAVEEVLSL